MDVSASGASSGDRAPTLCPAAAFALSRAGVLTALAMAVATLVMFRLVPALDLETAEAFYAGDNRFVGPSPAGENLRHLFSLIPFAILALMLGLYAARRTMRCRIWAPSGRGILVLLLSLALGPGLLVNVVLKDHSHRPRPVQTTDFGGPLPFRPVGSFDGACQRNCSFVSGEGSSAFWAVAPAMLAPLSVQPLALAAALCFGVVASLLRIAFGGHYLSDTIMAALLVWLVIAACWRLVMCRRPRLRPQPLSGVPS